MEVDLALLADAATIDSSGKLNILGVFDRLSTASFPTRHPHMVLILRFTASVQEIGRHRVEIALKDPTGQQSMHLDGEMHLGPGPTSVAGGIQVPHVLHIDGLIFPKPGGYAFDVRVDGQHQVSVPLVVVGPAGAAA